MSFSVEDIFRLRKYQVEWEESGEFLVSRSNALFKAESPNGPFQKLLTYPTSSHKNIVGKFQMGRRLLRHTFYNVLKFAPEQYFVSFGKSFATFKHRELELMRGSLREFRVLRSGFAYDGNDNLFFGEYIWNTERGEVHVYRASLSESRMEVVFTFPPKTIRHVHAVITDPYEDGMWLLAGDIGEECRLCITKDNFQTLEVVGKGDESWRIVTLEFTKDHIYYATDGEFEQNRIYRIDRKTGERVALADTEGTVLASSRMGEDLFFAVSGEKCPTNPTGQAVLWHVDTRTGAAQRLMTHRKDPWHQTYFQFGQYHFPCRYSPGLEGKLYLTAQGLQGVDGHTFCINSQPEQQGLTLTGLAEVGGTLSNR